VAKRLLLAIPSILGILVITFVISRVVPGDPLKLLVSERAMNMTVGSGSAGSYEALLNITRQRYGLDKPLYYQFLLFVWLVLHGDLGVSVLTGRSVTASLLQRFPATAELTTGSMIICVALGVPFGIVAAIKRNKPIDHISRALAMTGASMPIFWLGLLLLYVFYFKMGFFGVGRLSEDLIAPTHITGLYVLDSLLTGNMRTLVDSLSHLVLPSFTLGFFQMAMISRVTRSSLLDVLGQDYIRALRARGFSERVVIYKHALRNSLIPTVTMSGLAFGSSLGGAVLTETIFAWPGIGRYATDAMMALDYQPILGSVILAVVAYLIVNLIVDLFYTVLDPRIRYG
jgi:peptide/nickel transport system permease protein